MNLIKEEEPDGEKVDDSNLLGSGWTWLTVSVENEDGTQELLTQNYLCNSSYSFRPLR